MSQERTEGIMNSRKENFELRESVHKNRVRSETLEVRRGIMSPERTEGIINRQSENFTPSGSARNDRTSGKTSQMPQEIFSQEKTEGLLNNLRAKFNSRGSAHTDSVSSKTSQVPQEIMSHESAYNDRVMEANSVTASRSSSSSHENGGNENATVEKESILVSKICNQATNARENLVEVPCDDQQTGVKLEVGSQRQLLSSRISPPDWTMEQLDLLMVDD